MNSAETLQHLDACLGKRLHQDGRPFCVKSGPTVTRCQGGTAGQVGSRASLGLGKGQGPTQEVQPDHPHTPPLGPCGAAYVTHLRADGSQGPLDSGQSLQGHKHYWQRECPWAMWPWFTPSISATWVSGSGPLWWGHGAPHGCKVREGGRGGHVLANSGHPCAASLYRG